MPRSALKATKTSDRHRQTVPWNQSENRSNRCNPDRTPG
ncbi:hypothetical protein [Azospirillum palustre]